MRRREFIALLGGAAGTQPQRAVAQSERRRAAVPTDLPAGDPLGEPEAAAVEHRLKDLGWTATRNIQLDYRWPGSDFARLGAAAKEPVAWNPDVIIARATPPVAVDRDTTAIPIVFLQVTDPLGVGFVESLATAWEHATAFDDGEPR
jgi:putative ABC transport system substrate-binding protein